MSESVRNRGVSGVVFEVSGMKRMMDGCGACKPRPSCAQNSRASSTRNFRFMPASLECADPLCIADWFPLSGVVSLMRALRRCNGPKAFEGRGDSRARRSERKRWRLRAASIVSTAAAAIVDAWAAGGDAEEDEDEDADEDDDSSAPPALPRLSLARERTLD